MFFDALLALVPLLGAASASASVIPRESARFGQLHPYENGTVLCVAASEPVVGSVVGLVPCHDYSDPASELEFYNITNAAGFNMKQVALQAYPDLCLDGGVSKAGSQITLQKCDNKDTVGQFLNWGQEGYLSFPNTYCFHKKSESEIDVQSCFLFNRSIVFYPS